MSSSTTFTAPPPHAPRMGAIPHSSSSSSSSMPYDSDSESESSAPPPPPISPSPFSTSYPSSVCITTIITYEEDAITGDAVFVPRFTSLNPPIPLSPVDEVELDATSPRARVPPRPLGISTEVHPDAVPIMLEDDSSDDEGDEEEEEEASMRLSPVCPAIVRVTTRRDTVVEWIDQLPELAKTEAETVKHVSPPPVAWENEWEEEDSEWVLDIEG